MKNKRLCLNIIAVLLLAALAVVVLLGLLREREAPRMEVEDGTEQVDLDAILLKDSGVELRFADVIVGEHKETRKLIVDELDVEVSTRLTAKLIEKIDAEILQKTQSVTYKGKACFVVDLDNLTKANVVENKQEKTVTIQIGHARLESIVIDPNEVKIDAVQETLFARGKIKLTLEDFNGIEKELLQKINAQVNTERNQRNADALALEKVRDIYEPIVKAIDPRYRVVVEFK